MTIESQYLNVIYCKMTKAGTETSVSASVFGGALCARDRARGMWRGPAATGSRPSGVVGALGRIHAGDDARREAAAWRRANISDG